MKQLPLLSTLVAAILMLSAGLTAARAEQGYPKVEFVYSFIPFDRACAGWLKTEISQDLVKQTSEQVRAFQEYWDKEASALLGTAVKELGRPFRQREMIASLTLCPISSMGQPLIVNIRNFIDGRRPLYQFGALVFHELLHTYTTEVLGMTSNLLDKYCNEPVSVRAHLHVMAVQKMVYLKLGRTEDLNALIAYESAGSNSVYARSWEIVNKVEGHMPFVSELKHR